MFVYIILVLLLDSLDYWDLKSLEEGLDSLSVYSINLGRIYAFSSYTLYSLNS